MSDGSQQAPKQVQDWQARHQAIVATDDDTEHDRLVEQFDQDWREAYCAAFVAAAVARGWSQEDAESWPENIVEDALVEAFEHGWDPQLMAERDVAEIERECAAGT